MANTPEEIRDGLSFRRPVLTKMTKSGLEFSVHFLCSFPRSDTAFILEKDARNTSTLDLQALNELPDCGMVMSNK